MGLDVDPIKAGLFVGGFFRYFSHRRTGLVSDAMRRQNVFDSDEIEVVAQIQRGSSER